MSNDRYQEIRAALEMGPTPGPRRAVEQSVIGPQDLRILSANVTFSVGANGSHSVLIEEAVANAALAAACDPDTIRELLAERDQLAAALEAAREDAAEAKQNGYELGLLAGAQEAERLRGVIARYERKLDAAIDQARGKGGGEVGP